MVPVEALLVDSVLTFMIACTTQVHPPIIHFVAFASLVWDPMRIYSVTVNKFGNTIPLCLNILLTTLAAILRYTVRRAWSNKKSCKPDY
jgi:hypothetical protein